MIKFYRMPYSVLGLLSAAVILIGASVDAQTLRTPQESSEPVKVTNQKITISVNQSRSIDLGVGVTQAHITNEGVADVRIVPMGRGNPPKAFIIAKSVGATNMFFFTKDGNQVHHLDVRVTLDHQGIEEALAELLGRRSVKVSVFRDTVYLKGSVRSAAESAKAIAIARRFVPAPENLVSLLSIQGSQQVVLQVRVAEIKRNIRKILSVDQTFSQSLTDDKLLNFGTTGIFSTTSAAFASGTIITQLPGFGPTNFQVLEQQGLVKTLAEPTLTAVSGETATFLSGGEFPVPTGTDQNGNAIITFREFGVRLSFTPVVIENDRINIRIATEVSARDDTNAVTINGSTIPAITNKKTETTIELPSGGSFMIAGLLEDNVTDIIDGLPGLKDLPILGALFRSTDFLANRTELVVTVTAYLVKPTGGKNASLSLPTDGFEPASDIDHYLLGRLHRQYSKKDRKIWAPKLKGPFGYIME